MQARTGISERRACQLIGLSRSVLRYQPRARVQNTELQAQLVELAQERRRFGYRRLHILLRRAGVQVNHKRIYRLYRAARIRIAAWRRDYNEHRPHSAIGNLTPAEFAASWRTRQQQLKQEKLISTPGPTN